MATNTTPVLNNNVYDWFRRLVEIGLPGAGTLYFTLAQIWDFPYGEQVIGSLAAVAIFGGVMLRVSRKQYDNSEAKYDGQMLINHNDPMVDNYTIDLGDTAIFDLDNKKEVVLKVNTVPEGH